MTHADPHRLIAGPYTPPALRRGDRATCLYRDRDVVITTWTDARISWPRCRGSGSGAGAGLLIDDELVRAIRTESAAAIKYWWGVNGESVWRWRKAFGVTRVNNPGSHRLVRAAAKQGAERQKQRVFTATERAQYRRRAIRLNLGRFFKHGYHGRRWTTKELALLGKLADAEVAARIGRTVTAVRVQRLRLQIPLRHNQRRRWTRAEDAIVRSAAPAVAARKIGRPLQAVYRRRFWLGVAGSRVNNGRPARELARLARNADANTE